VETSQRPELRADVAGRLKRTGLPPAVATMATTRAGRSSPAPSDVVPEIEDADPDDTDLLMSGDRHTGPIRPTARRGGARRTLADMGDRLLADARDPCRREGVAATRRELLIRVAERVGLPQAEVARGLGGAPRRDGAPTASAGPAARHLRDRVLRLAETILGERERAVFLARRVARSDDIAALHALASSLGLSVERVYELESSARRKLAMALRQPRVRGATEHR